MCHSKIIKILHIGQNSKSSFSFDNSKAWVMGVGMQKILPRDGATVKALLQEHKASPTFVDF